MTEDIQTLGLQGLQMVNISAAGITKPHRVDYNTTLIKYLDFILHRSEILAGLSVINILILMFNSLFRCH